MNMEATHSEFEQFYNLEYFSIYIYIFCIIFVIPQRQEPVLDLFQTFNDILSGLKVIYFFSNNYLASLNYKSKCYSEPNRFPLVLTPMIYQYNGNFKNLSVVRNYPGTYFSRDADIQGHCCTVPNYPSTTVVSSAYICRGKSARKTKKINFKYSRTNLNNCY